MVLCHIDSTNNVGLNKAIDGWTEKATVLPENDVIQQRLTQTCRCLFILLVELEILINCTCTAKLRVETKSCPSTSSHKLFKLVPIQVVDTIAIANTTTP